MKMNGYRADVRKAVKGPYRKTDVKFWRDQGKSLWDRTVTAGVDKWKWVRFLR
jgi:hypothetical protein